MKILSNQVAVREQMAQTVLMPETFNDIYNLYHFLEIGDKIYAFTTRKINPNDRKPDRIRVALILKVEGLTADLEAGFLFVKGLIQSEIKYLYKNAYHTTTIGLRSIVMIEKEHVTSLNLGWLLYQEKGKVLMYILVTNKQIFFYEVSVSSMFLRKTLANNKQNYRNMSRSGFIKSLANFELIIIGCSSALVADSIKTMLTRKRTGIRPDRIMWLHIDDQSPNHKREIEKSFSLMGVKNQILSSQYLKEVHEMNLFMEYHEEGKLVCVGLDEVEECLNFGAAKSILISDDLFKKHGVDVRWRADEICRLAREMNAKVSIVPAALSCGEFLLEIGGVGAILKYEYKFETEE